MLDLDLISFSELVEVSVANNYRNKVEDAWTLHAASQAQTDDFKKGIIKPFETVYDSLGEEVKDDSEKLIKKFGKSI